MRLLKSKKTDYLDTARQVLGIEIDSLKDLSRSLNENFSLAVDAILKCKGRVIVTGMGKSGIICKKIAATLTSTRTQAVFMHPSDAMHGDLGLITRNDIVIAVSHSGETREIAELIPHLKLMKTRIIAITSNPGSDLAKEADVLLTYKIEREGCPLNLAPMASTTTVLALGDAIAAALMKAKNVKEEDFYLFHPQGRLGQTLLCVSDLMVKTNLPIVQRHTPMREVIKILVSTNFGAVLMEGSKGHLRGIITDGDIKRLVEEDESFLQKKSDDFAKAEPKWIFEDSLAREALMIMEENRITLLPVLGRDKKIAGVIHIHDIVKHNYGRRK
ncbi:MAG: KpsF/GutQ family sugar-phosphate isomerase [Spirochaetota bacterium]